MCKLVRKMTGFLIVMVTAGLLYAPPKEKTLAVKFFDKVRGTYEEKVSAYAGFKHWPGYFGHTQKEIYDLCRKESEFKVYAYNYSTEARGLTQVKYVAMEDVAPPPDGRKFFNYVWINGKRLKSLNKKHVYRPYLNLYAGCAYYRKCKNRARAQRIGKYKFTRMEVAKAYYVSGIGKWKRSIRPMLEYIQE